MPFLNSEDLKAVALTAETAYLEKLRAKKVLKADKRTQVQYYCLASLWGGATLVCAPHPV
jgi:hypothetical protein